MASPFHRLLRFNSAPLSPLPDAFVYFIPCHAIPHKPKSDTQLRFDITIPTLIIKEQHVRKLYLTSCSPSRILNSLEVVGLAAGKDLLVCKNVDRAQRFGIWVIIWRWYAQAFQHILCKVRCMSSTGEPNCDALVVGSTQDCGHAGIKSKSLIEPIEHIRATIGRRRSRLYRTRHVCIHPEGPQSIVQIKDDERRQRKCVNECGWY